MNANSAKALPLRFCRIFLFLRVFNINRKINFSDINFEFRITNYELILITPFF